MPDDLDSTTTFQLIDIDPIHAAICKKLFPNDFVAHTPFEEARVINGHYDAVISNIPFGDWRVFDDTYKPMSLLIHDYYFVKSLDKVKKGGLVAFITSTGTMDKKDSSTRQYIADRADLLGAIRLPGGTFSDSANTDVATNIIFLRKRGRKEHQGGGAFVNTDNIELEYQGELKTLSLNEYFHAHPEMMLGTPAYSGHLGGKLLIEAGELPLDILINNAVAFLPVAALSTHVAEPEASNAIIYDEGKGVLVGNIIESKPGVFDLVIDQYKSLETGDICLVTEPVKVRNSDIPRLQGLLTLRDMSSVFLRTQMSMSETGFVNSLTELNNVYDQFISEFGSVNHPSNAKLLIDEVSAPQVWGLENYDDDSGEACKSDLLKGRVFNIVPLPETVDNPREALLLSLNHKGAIDTDFIAGLLNTHWLQAAKLLESEIYFNPESGVWELAALYLSGNVRIKLENAQKLVSDFPDLEDNIAALKAVLPASLNPEDIDLQLGNPLVSPEIVKDFVLSLVADGDEFRDDIEVSYVPEVGKWDLRLNHSFRDAFEQECTVVFGTQRRNLSDLLNHILSGRSPKVMDEVRDPNGETKKVLNKDATADAIDKITLIQDSFDAWVWDDEERADFLTLEYNRRFRSYVSPEYDASFLQPEGLSSCITPYVHQLEVTIRALFEGRLLSAHCVGAGKSLEQALILLESKRFGLCNKPLLSVPNHMLSQITRDCQKFFPTANILMVSRDDMSKQRRRRLLAKIAYNSFDMVVVSHSIINQIGAPEDFEAGLIQEELYELEYALNQMKASNEDSRLSTKMIEAAKKKLNTRLKTLATQIRNHQDKSITLADLGVDAIAIDEAHLYKNLAVTTTSNISGISNASSQRAWSMLMKVRYIQSINQCANGKASGVYFFTGTPIANSMVELYTQLRYLAPNVLIEAGISHFDAFLRTFCRVKTQLEMLPEGSGYRLNERLAEFTNLEDLICIVRTVFDIKTRDDLNLPTPNVERITVVAEQSPFQKAFMQHLTLRARKVRDGSVDKHIDNLLRISTHGRRAALDLRLLDNRLPDFKGSKINILVDNVVSEYHASTAQLGAQLIFCDQGTPNTSGFCLYDDIRNKVIAKGIPSETISFIHSAKNDEDKDRLSRKIRTGKIRVLIASTEKGGTGLNIQKRLAALHHLDCPWRPCDIGQREGRIDRQGNIFEYIKMFTYTTADSFDIYMWATNERKAKFIVQGLSNPALIGRQFAEDTDTNDYAEIVAVTTGNPLIREKVALDMKVNALKRKRKQSQSDKLRLRHIIFDTKRKLDYSKAEASTSKANGHIMKTNKAKQGGRDFTLVVNGI
ncbi:MAG: helicase-related protein, partial [Pseudomonadales bacterium]